MALVRAVAVFATGFTFASAGARSSPPRAASPARLPPPAVDRSPHREGVVEHDGVRLHFLDWGGAGSPVVLLPALGSTAHAFDEFAPQLAGRYRVISVTRRGFGASDRPAAGYDTPTLTADVLAVLDRLGLQQATVVGHSMGGAEAVWLAVHHPERVARVILLESYCYGCPQAPPAHTAPPVGAPPARPRATPADLRSLATFRAFNARLSGAPLPVAELVATHRVAGDGHVLGNSSAPAAMAGVRRAVMRSEVDRVRQPMLLVLAIPEAPEDEYRWVRPLLGRARTWAEWAMRLDQAKQRAWAAEFRRAQPRGIVRWVPHGAHHVYLSHPAEVARLLTDFIG